MINVTEYKVVLGKVFEFSLFTWDWVQIGVLDNGQTIEQFISTYEG